MGNENDRLYWLRQHGRGHGPGGLPGGGPRRRGAGQPHPRQGPGAGPGAGLPHRLQRGRRRLRPGLSGGQAPDDGRDAGPPAAFVCRPGSPGRAVCPVHHGRRADHGPDPPDGRRGLPGRPHQSQHPLRLWRRDDPLLHPGRHPGGRSRLLPADGRGRPGRPHCGKPDRRRQLRVGLRAGLGLPVHRGAGRRRRGLRPAPGPRPSSTPPRWCWAPPKCCWRPAATPAP